MADEVYVNVREVWDGLDDFAETFKTSVKVEGTIKVLGPAQFHDTLHDNCLRPLPVEGAHVVLPQQRWVNVVAVGTIVGENRIVVCGCHCFWIVTAKVIILVRNDRRLDYFCFFAKSKPTKR